jgi:succinoglycan biosynthesis protein ExoA
LHNYSNDGNLSMKSLHHNDKQHPTPLVTVIIPIRNEAVFISSSLGAVLAQTYPADRVETIVADGMSTDDTRKIILNLAATHPLAEIQILDNPGKIVPNGMNIALRRAKGEIIIRIDGHTLIASDYVHECVETLKRTNADNVGGKMNATGSNPFGRAVALATSTPFGIGGGHFHYSDIEEFVDTVYMGAWPRRVFEKIGLFDEELIRDQDDEFNYRLLSAGGKILLNPAIKSEYAVRSSPRGLWKQYFQYGFWKVRVLQKHTRQMRLRQFIPPVFVLTLIATSLLALLIPVGWIVLALVSGSYLLANLTASLITGTKKGWKYLQYLPLTFSILHISYGLGFLMGLVRFANRWGDKQGKVPEL